MRKNKKGNGHHHLTLSDRIYIESELNIGSTFKSIADVLGKDPSTISKEVRHHRKVPDHFKYQYTRCSCFDCRLFRDCEKVKKVDSSFRTYYSLARSCDDFNIFSCDRLYKAPYVCNGCPEQRCKKSRLIYKAENAQKVYEKTLSDSRKGINMTPEELQELNDLISPLILKGQPLSHIFAVHADEIPVCRRTLYNYLDQRIFQARNIDLPRRVRYKKRTKHSDHRTRKIEQVYRSKRTYKDFERFMEGYPDSSVVEMDTVKGSRASGKCLLTLLFRSCNFMIIILLSACTQECVIKAINDLTDAITLRLFRKYFRVILTDNGPEFKNPWDIEKTPDGKHRTYVFYCDPYKSTQKAKIEKNHEYIRYVIPKGRSMNRYTQDDINLMASHINSTARDGMNGASPFDLAGLLIDKRIPILVGQHRVNPDSVMLRPELIDKPSAKRRITKHEKS